MNLSRGGGGGHRRVSDPIKLPRLPSIASSFPSSDERVQLQAIAEQSRRFLRRLAYSLPTAKHTWDELDTDNNMELYQIKDKSSGDDLVNLCGVASVYGTLAEVADALFIPQVLPDPVRRGPTTFVDDILGSNTLLRVDGKTSIKWMAIPSVDGMVHRDFVVLHSCERFEDIENRGVVISLHSLDFPGAPPSFETSIHSAYRFVRGGIYRSGFVLLENASTPGIIDVVSVFKVDLKGGEVRGAAKQHRATVASWLHWMGDLNKYLLCEKLRRVGPPRLRRDGVQTPLASTKARRQCESCDAPFKFHFRPRTPKTRRHQCMMCSAVLCNACTVEYTESAVTPTAVFCIPCLVKWNPDGPTIKFIQPPATTIGSPASAAPQIHLRSQVHHRFVHDQPSSASSTPVAKRPATGHDLTSTRVSLDTNIPILGDEEDDFHEFTPPQHPSALLAVSDTDLHRLDLLVQVDQPRRPVQSPDDFFLDDTLPRHTAVFGRSVVPEGDESADDPAASVHDAIRRLKQGVHEAVGDVVRESSRGNTAAAKVALERRNDLKRQIKHLQDSLTAQGVSFPRSSSERPSSESHALTAQGVSFPRSSSERPSSESHALTAQGVSFSRSSSERPSSESRVSLRDDLRASQLEVLGLRSKDRDSVESAFSQASIEKLNPTDIAALQAKMDGLLKSTSSTSDESLDEDFKRTIYVPRSPTHVLPAWRKSSDDGLVRQEAPTVVTNLPKSNSTGSLPRMALGIPDDVRFSDIQIFTASNKRVDVKDLNLLDDIHSFAL